MKIASMIRNMNYALKNIWKWDNKYFLWFLLIIPASILFPLIESWFPKILIDQIQQKNNITSVLIVLFLYFSILLFVNLIGQFANSRMNMRRCYFSNECQHEIVQKRLYTDFCNIDTQDFNMKYTTVMNDACSGQCAIEVICYSILNLFIDILGIFSYGTILILLSPTIILFLILSSVLTYTISRWQQNYAEKNKKNYIAIDRKIGYLSSFSSRIDFAKDIRIYGMTHWLESLLTKFQKERFLWNKKIGNYTLIGKFMTFILTLLSNAVTYGVLIWLILRGEIGVGDFVFYFGIITTLSGWMNSLAGDVSEMVSICVRIGYYQEYFQIPDTLNHESGYSSSEKIAEAPEIEFCHVSYCYSTEKEQQYALKDINLKIRAGEKLAIVGVNGAGKTTLVKLLCGLYIPTEGEVRLNGIPVTDYNILYYYSLFSVVFQDMYLLPVTIAEFIASDNTNIEEEKVHYVLRLAGLEQKIQALPKGIHSHLMKGVFDDSIELSGGEKQKLMFARALYKNAPVVVLDEPTAALDPIAENELYQKYGNLTQEKTSIYISHRLASTRFCDRIVLIDNKTIAESGSHEELMKTGGKYAKMFEIQSQYYKEENHEAEK